MKKLIFTFLIIFSQFNFVYSQSGWSSIFFNNVNTVSKIIQRDSSNYLALCYYSQYFYKSSDAGNSWLSSQNFSFDSAYTFIDGQFLNSQTGWIVGWNTQFYDGAIFKTINGGINWIRQNTGYNNYGCRSLCFLNENTGWIGTSGGTTGWLLKTTNGGNNWTKQDFPGAYRIEGVKFLDSNNGWILGLYGVTARTTDGGQTWIQKTINNNPCSSFQYWNLYALSPSECWVLMDCVNFGLVYSHLFKTTNGGDYWNLMFSYTDSLYTNAHSFWKIVFSNSSNGYTNGDFNFVFRTTNSGINWSKIYVASVPFIYPVISSILLINTNEIFAGGGYSGLGSYEPFNYRVLSR